MDAVFYALVADLAGAPHEIINSTTGEVVGRVAQTLYGKRVWAGCCSSPLLFAGQYVDGESGWVYNRFRFYNPGLGGFNAQDPLGLMPRLASAQGYVDHAACWVDPLGLLAHVANALLRRRIDALTPNHQGQLGGKLAQDMFAGQCNKNNMRAFYEEASGKNRISDITLNTQSIVEAKFVKKQGFTTQIRDGIHQARLEGGQYHLVTAPETHLSGPLRAAIERGDVIHRTVSEADIARAIGF